jgi:16S rRNA (adenine1518-N6/adenine1519-N6)-dimethyltransferase
MIRPRKHFSQNFLIDPHVIQQIMDCFNIRPSDTVCEIGPGRGALTGPLLEKLGTLTAIEIDRDLSKALTLRYPTSQLRLLNQDVLKTDFSRLSPATVRIIGNLPYHISTPILFHLLQYKDHIQDMHFMLQKEVVDRMTAKPSTPDYGRLSVMIQYHCAVQKKLEIPPTAFYPKPKVTSAMIALKPYPIPPCLAHNVSLFSLFVNLAFQQRRKMIANSLQRLLQQYPIDPKATLQAIFEATDIQPQQRPESLSVEAFVALSNLIHQALSA